MPKEEKSPELYVRQVLESTQRYTTDLLFENEKLRRLVAALQEEKGIFEAQVNEARRMSAAADDVRAELTALRKEKVRLEEELTDLREELQRNRSEQSRLISQIEEIEAESRRLAERYVQVEQQNSSLANLYVASFQLHETLNREEVLTTLREIIVNLIGSEEFGIFELESKASLTLATAMGIDTDRYRRIPVDESVIGRVVTTGRSHFGDGNDGHFGAMAACIPLKLEGRVIGTIALFRLLEHKAALEPVDHQLLNLLATHAATALHCTRLHARIQAGDVH
jgi:predicted nuclease with TOPRIM domain